MTPATPPFKSPHLNKVLAAELHAGNRVAQDGDGWGKITRLVILHSPFRSSLNDLPDAVEHHDINDPHYWKAELKDRETNEMLACGFAFGEDAARPAAK